MKNLTSSFQKEETGQKSKLTDVQDQKNDYKKVLESNYRSKYKKNTKRKVWANQKNLIQ